MVLSNMDLRSIDRAAQHDRQKELEDPERPKTPPRPGAVGPLNALRARWMLHHLGLATASLEKAEAAMRQNWPEDWRCNEQGHRFHETEFLTLAILALIDHQTRPQGKARTNPVAPFVPDRPATGSAPGPNPPT